MTKINDWLSSLDFDICQEGIDRIHRYGTDLEYYNNMDSASHFMFGVYCRDSSRALTVVRELFVEIRSNDELPADVLAVLGTLLDEEVTSSQLHTLADSSVTVSNKYKKSHVHYLFSALRIFIKILVGKSTNQFAVSKVIDRLGQYGTMPILPFVKSRVTFDEWEAML